MSNEELEIKASIWCQAISEEAFCGQPSRYDDDYEALLTELGKLESVHDDECNWQEVRRAADALTREKTKDMQVLSALCVAEWKLSKASGLAAAVFAYRELMEKHSRELFPNAARRRGRAGAYGWMIKGLEKDFADFAPLPEDYEGLKACHDQLTALDEILRNELEEEHPGSRACLDTLGGKVAAVAPADVAAPQGESNADEGALSAVATTESVVAAAAPATARAVAIDANVNVRDESSARATLGAALGALAKVADYFSGSADDQQLGHQLRHTVSLLEDASFVGRPEPTRKLIEQAKAVASREGLEQGCNILENALKSVGRRDERFELRIALADLCTENKAAALAYPILKDLEEELKQPVNEWMPRLEAERARSMLQCFQTIRQMGEDDVPSNMWRDADGDWDDVMTLLSRLAPAVAARFKSSGNTFLSALAITHMSAHVHAHARRSMAG